MLAQVVPYKNGICKTVHVFETVIFVCVFIFFFLVCLKIKENVVVVQRTQRASTIGLLSNWGLESKNNSLRRPKREIENSYRYLLFVLDLFIGDRDRKKKVPWKTGFPVWSFFFGFHRNKDKLNRKGFNRQGVKKYAHNIEKDKRWFLKHDKKKTI